MHRVNAAIVSYKRFFDLYQLQDPVVCPKCNIENYHFNDSEITLSKFWFWSSKNIAVVLRRQILNIARPKVYLFSTFIEQLESHLRPLSTKPSMTKRGCVNNIKSFIYYIFTIVSNIRYKRESLAKMSLMINNNIN